MDYTSLPAECLLHLLRHGEPDQKQRASAELFRRHAPRLDYHICQLFPTLRNSSEDIIQEVFSNFFLPTVLATIEAHGLPQWLLAATYNRSVDWLRRALRGGRTLSLDGFAEELLGGPGGAPEDEIVLDDLLSTLPAEERTVWLLHVHEERPLREVAEQMGWLTRTGKPAITRVFNALARARDHLARLLRERAED